MEGGGGGVGVHTFLLKYSVEELSLQPDHLESTVLLFSFSLLPLIFE